MRYVTNTRTLKTCCSILSGCEIFLSLIPVTSKKKSALARQYFLKQSENLETQNGIFFVYSDEGQYANDDQFTAIHGHNFYNNVNLSQCSYVSRCTRRRSLGLDEPVFSSHFLQALQKSCRFPERLLHKHRIFTMCFLNNLLCRA